MPKMTEQDLITNVNILKHEAVTLNQNMITLNNDYLSRYLCEDYGDETDHRSRVKATDAQDTVESDMPTLARIFLAGNDIITAEPVNPTEQSTLEAEEKTKYINHLIRSSKNYFKTHIDFLKDVEIQKYGVLKFYYQEDETTEELTLSGLNADEWVSYFAEYQEGDDAIEIISINDIKEFEEFDPSILTEKDELTVKITTLEKEYCVDCIETESFLISPNAKNKDDAYLIGNTGLISRGELIKAGYQKSLIDEAPNTGYQSNNGLTLKNTRFEAQGGTLNNWYGTQWAAEKVVFYDLYVMIDYDGDGILERRRIYMIGESTILENDAFPLVPYAVTSAITLSNSAIGRSRVELSMQNNRVNTVLMRQMLDNIYNVNNGRMVVNDEMTNIDDLLVVRHNGIVRTKDNPQNAVFPLIGEYIGDKVLQIIQYQDFRRSQSLGTTMANQGLDADRFYNETATRFQGVEDSGAAKIELVARCIAEIAYRDLFEGMCKLVTLHQNSKIEISVLGKELTVDPRKWRYKHNLTSNVGLAAGDDERTLENLTILLNAQKEMLLQRSPLVDQKKMYNTIAKICKALGIKRVDEHFNDPEKPEELLLSQNEQLMQMVEELQAQVQTNPLAEAEGIKAQADLIKAQSKQELDMLKLQEDMRQFNHNLMAKLTEIDAKYAVDIPGTFDDIDFVFDVQTGQLVNAKTA